MRVHDLAMKLRRDEVDVAIDADEISPAQGWPRWCEEQIHKADYVLIVCTESYARRFDGKEVGDVGKGAQWEGTLIRQLIYDSVRGAGRFVPVIFGTENAKFIPRPLRGFTYFDVLSDSGYKELVRLLRRGSSIERSESRKEAAVPEGGQKPALRTIRISIFSPGDVQEEREEARNVVESLASQYARLARLIPVMWEHEPLDVVSELLSSEEDIDIAIFIFWSRLGSPLGPSIKRPDGTEYRSAIEREFDLVLAASKASGGQRPAVIVYKREDNTSFNKRLGASPLAAEEEIISQKKLVEEFFQRAFRDQATGVYIRAYYSYKDPTEFRERLRTHLVLTLDRLLGIDSEALRVDTLSSDQGEVARQARQVMVALAADADDGDDCLNVAPEVEAFSSVLALSDLQPPLCLGIFGDWGSGKTFFMKKLQARVAWLCAKSEGAETKGAKTAFCCRVAQITFNAWHYVDANLWASIACRIFEGLDQFISEHSLDPEARKAQLFKQLVTAREKLEEAKSATEAAKQQVNLAETQLEDLERHRREKTLQLEDVRAVAIKKALIDNPEVRERLEDAAKQVGLEQLAGNVKELEEVLTGFRTISGRIQAMFLALVYGKDRWWRIGFLIGILVLIPLLGIGLEKLLAHLNATGTMGQLAAIVTQVGAIVAALSTWLVKNLRWATGIVDRVDKAQGEADTLLREARAKATPQEAQLQKELVSLKQKEATARTVLKEGQEKVQQAEKEKQQLEERANGKVLAEFIREKVTGATYQGQLGIISTIRKDLNALSDILAAAKRFREQLTRADEGTAKPQDNLPRIDRIILYIDDLDRCPEKTVVEVLQAVHLLLAFPLFIVVIGVDSRWLLRSLRHHYAALRGLEEGADLQAFDGATQFSSTPQNYLEKIIQVPFNLRRMDSHGFQRLMENILPFKHQSEVLTPLSAEQATPSATPPVTHTADTPKAESDQPKESKEQAEKAVMPGDKNQPADPIIEDFDPMPEALIVTEKEVDFMAELVSLIPTPRAAKRLGNIYRLIRAGISSAELERFLGDGDGKDQYKVVMTLLSIQVGFPLVANDIFNQIRSNPNYSWAEIRAEMNDKDEPAEAQRRDLADWQHESPRVWRRERSRLANCLDALLAEQKLTDSLGGYARWIQRVNRYSFRAAERD